MKNLHTKFFLGLFIMIMLVNISIKAQIYSTAAGGPWDSTWTWVAGVVPGGSDNVVLNGPVHSNGNSCNDLTLNTNGELYNTGYSITFTVNGSVINNGNIRNNSGWYFTMNVNGNITNNGIWTNRVTYLIGTGTHILLQNGAVEFSGYEFNAVEGTGLITVMSDFNFFNTRIVLNGATIELDDSKGGNLFVNDKFIDNGSLIANNHNLFMEGNAYIEDLILSDVTLTGVIQINGPNVVFNGNTVLNGTLQNYGYSYDVTVYDNFTNNGIIQNRGNGWYLYMDLFGNIINNGVWNNRDIELRGQSDHYVSCLNGNVFAVSDFSDQEPEGLIIALTDIYFINCNINLNYDTLLMPNTSLLSISDGYIINSVVYSPEGTITLNMDNDSYIQSCDISEVTLEGIIECNNTDFYGDIILEGTLQNYQYSISVNIYGDIINNGVIRNKGNGWNLNMKNYGDIINNGSWTNRNTFLEGTEEHSITQGPGSEFAGYEFNAVAGTGLITFMTDVNFHNTRLLLNGGTIEIDNSKGGNISMDGAFFKNGTLIANGHELYQTGNAYIEGLTISDVTLKGIVQISGNNVIFNGNIVLQDTIQNYSSTCNLTVNNNFTNYGLVRNKGNGYLLNTDHFGDIVNNGAWTNRTLYLNGAEPHSITQGEGSEFSNYEFNAVEGTGLITFMSDINFHNTRLLLNGGTIEIDNSKGGNISMNGAFFQNGTLIANSHDFYQTGNAYIEDITISDVTLKGIIKINGNNVIFNGNIILQDTIQNNYSHSNLTVNSDFTNNGVIRNNGIGYNLYMDLFGNIINNGVWNNYDIELRGESDQDISCLNENVFDVHNFIDQEPDGLINALTDIYFVNCNFNLNYDTLLMPNNSLLSISNGYIYKSVVYSPGGTITLNMENSAYIQDCDISDVTLTGIIECKSTDFYGDIILDGTMLNEYSTYTVNINGNITNNGIVKNNGTAYKLYVNITGNLSNNGEWSNYSTKMTGISEQHIYLHYFNDIIGQMHFVSDILASPYQWQYNGSNLPASPDYSGQTSSTLVFNIPITEDLEGTFNCSTGGGMSRDIIIESIYGPPIANFVADPTSWYAPMEVNFTDLSSPGISAIIEWFWEFGDGNTSYLQNPIHTYENLGTYTVSLTVTDENQLSGTETKIDYIKVLPVQQIELSTGYSFISTRIIPEDPNFLSICGDILPNLDFVRNTAGDMFRKIGPVWVNGIGDWVTTEGYLFRMNAADELFILGDIIDPQTPISLMEGYQFISYLPENSINALTVFNDVLDNLDFVRNSTGGMLRKIGPIWVNGIGDLNPGEGYLVKMLNADELIYPATSFPCGDSFTDPRDGQVYNTVLIGDHCWMAENLNIGEMINGTEDMADNGVIEKYCYEDNTANCDEYGGLYQWDEMMQYSITQGVQGICPAGWHISTDDEWKILEGTVDSQYPVGDPEWNDWGWRGFDAGLNLKSTSGWNNNGNGNDLYGFTALPGGYRFSTYGDFYSIEERAYFWTSTEDMYNYSSMREIYHPVDDINRNVLGNYLGFSVRCLLDNSKFGNLSIKDKNKDYDLLDPKITNIESVHFVFEGGNAADPVFTIYIEGLNTGDEVAAFDGDKMIGSVMINSQNAFDNDLAVFNTINSGQGYQSGNPIQLKVWDSFSQKICIAEFEMIDPYNEAYMQKVYPNEDGLYSVVKISKNSIGMENIDNEISIYPNPSNGIITIENLTGLSLEITDLRGRIFFQSKIVNQTKQSKRHEVSPYGPVWEPKMKIDLSDIESGVYFIRINGKNFNKVEKIVIQ